MLWSSRVPELCTTVKGAEHMKSFWWGMERVCGASWPSRKALRILFGFAQIVASDDMHPIIVPGRAEVVILDDRHQLYLDRSAPNGPPRNSAAIHSPERGGWTTSPACMACSGRWLIRRQWRGGFPDRSMERGAITTRVWSNGWPRAHEERLNTLKNTPFFFFLFLLLTFFSYVAPMLSAAAGRMLPYLVQNLRGKHMQG